MSRLNLPPVERPVERALPCSLQAISTTLPFQTGSTLPFRLHSDRLEWQRGTGRELVWNGRVVDVVSLTRPRRLRHTRRAPLRVRRDDEA
jgi:hypothetical protein